jgi:hypothetical protein
MVDCCRFQSTVCLFRGVLHEEHARSCAAGYIEGALYQLNRFVESYGSEGKKEINEIASSHVLTIVMDTNVSYCGCDLKDSKLRILFNPRNLGFNVSDALTDLGKIASKTPSPNSMMSLNARVSAQVYAKGIIKDLEEMKTILGTDKFIIDPCFQKNYTTLKEASNLNDHWDIRIGETTLDYVQAIKDNLIREGFKGDSLHQEGFQEAVTENEMQIRVVKKLSAGSYSQMRIYKGILVLEVLDNSWGCNVYDAGSDIMQIL